MGAEAAVLPWARRLIAHGRNAGALPRYGDDEWRRLADADPRKVAAAVVAAECWRLDGERLPWRIADEIIAARAAADRLEAEEFAAVAEHVRSFANRPGQVERVERGFIPRDPKRRPALPDHLLFGEERRRWLGEAS